MVLVREKPTCQQINGHFLPAGSAWLHLHLTLCLSLLRGRGDTMSLLPPASSGLLRTRLSLPYTSPTAASSSTSCFLGCLNIPSCCSCSASCAPSGMSLLPLELLPLGKAQLPFLQSICEAADKRQDIVFL